MGMRPSFMFDFLEMVFPFLFIGIFLLILSLFVYGIISGVKQQRYNNKQPILTIMAKVVGKRDRTSRSTHNDHHSYSTTYYATFEVESGDRMELQIGNQEFGLLAEGDEGKLTFQGTRYLGFERQKKN